MSDTTRLLHRNAEVGQNNGMLHKAAAAHKAWSSHFANQPGMCGVQWSVKGVYENKYSGDQAYTDATYSTICVESVVRQIRFRQSTDKNGVFFTFQVVRKPMPLFT